MNFDCGNGGGGHQENGCDWPTLKQTLVSYLELAPEHAIEISDDEAQALHCTPGWRCSRTRRRQAECTKRHTCWSPGIFKACHTCWIAYGPSGPGKSSNMRHFGSEATTEWSLWANVVLLDVVLDAPTMRLWSWPNLNRHMHTISSLWYTFPWPVAF